MSAAALRFLVMAFLLFAAGCARDGGNVAPPKVEEPIALPQQISTVVVPVSAPLAEIERRLNATAPKTLWTIDKLEPRCIPAQRVNACAIPKKECHKGVCKVTGCKLGWKKLKLSPDISCRIVGEVTRGPIRVAGSGDALKITMPVDAIVRAEDVGGIIEQETATASAIVYANARLDMNKDWKPRAKIALDYDWKDTPHVEFLGRRIDFASKADPALQKVMTDLERKLEAELAKTDVKSKLAGAWAQGFTSIELNRRNPPVWMRISPRQLGFGGYRVRDGDLELVLALEAVTETFVGDRPPDPQVTPLPPPAAKVGERGLRFNLPVLADYRVLEPVIVKALTKLNAKGIVLPRVGRIDATFSKATVYATEGNRIAVGVETHAEIRGSPLGGVNGTIWLAAVPYNDENSVRIGFRDVKVAGETDRESLNLLIRLFEQPAVVAEIEKALTLDFRKNYDKVLVAARKAVADKQLGQFAMTATIEQVEHGHVQVTGGGLFLPVQATGKARISFRPERAAAARAGGR